MTSENTDPSIPPGRERSPAGFFLVGVVFLLAGTYALAYPFIATLAVNVVTGIALLVAGVVTLGHSWVPSNAHWHGRRPNTISGVVLLVVGGLMLVFPGYGIVGMTVIAIVFFLAGGIMKLALGLSLRPHDLWLIVVFHGALSAALGLLLLLAMPNIAAWAVGMLIGIDILFTGCWLIACATALSRRRAQQSGKVATGH